MRCVSCLTARNSWLAAALVAAAVLTLSACSDDTVAPADFGSLRVNVITDGDDRSTNYMLTVGDDPQISIGVNGSVLLHQIPVGSHELQLSGLRSNCSTSSTTATVDVLKGNVAETEFRISCVARNGSITVSVVTTGTGPDPDGYVVMIDGAAATPLDGSTPVTIAGVREGSHQVRLAGLAPNCFGGGTITPMVYFGSVATIQFAIMCISVGSVRVSVSTVGQSIDANGYRLRIGARSIAITASATVVVDTIATGTYAVSLEDVAANCEVAAPAETSAIVSLNGTTEIQFGVSCAGIGSIVVSTTTTGSSLDPDGYHIILDDIQVAWAPSNGQVAIPNVAAGLHRIRLAGIASNCMGDGEVTRTVTANLIATAQFAVVCVTQTGAVVVSVTTTGPSTDGNGYAVWVGPQNVVVATGGSVLFDNVAVGNQMVDLVDVAVDCEVSGSASQNVSVILNQITYVEFSVTCTATTMIAYAALVANNWDVYVTTSNGEGMTRLTTEAGRDLEPAWSSNGRIAFASERTGNFEIYVMNADGSNQTRVTNNAAADRHPTWSADGSKIAFTSSRDGNAEIYSMNADGTGVERLTNSAEDEGEPAWSPTAAKLAFTRQLGGRHQLHVMNSDGTGIVRLSNSAHVESGPAWSRDGLMLALARLVVREIDSEISSSSEISVLKSDGVGPSHFVAMGESPTWSPDGRWIAYSSNGLWATNDLAQHQTNIIKLPASAATPAWRW